MVAREQQLPSAALRSDRSNSRANEISSVSVRPYLVPFTSTKMNRSGRNATATFLALPRESEDARITGSTRSLDRRLLALNMCGTLIPSVIVDSKIA